MRKRFSQTIGKRPLLRSIPSTKRDTRGSPLVIVHTFSPYYRHGSISLSLSFELRDLSRHVPPDPIRLLVDRRFTNPAGANRNDKPLESVPSSLGQELCESCSCGDSKPVELWEGGWTREARSSISRRSVRRSSILLRADFRKFRIGFLL